MLIDELYSKNKDKTFDYLLSKTNDIEISKELTNDIFLKVYANLSKFDENKGKFLPWLYEITNNTLIDYLRKKKLNKSDYDTEQIYDNNNFFTTIEYDDINIKILDIIKKIPNENMKKIAKLHFINELSYEEITKALHLPLGTVKGNINRAKENIKHALYNTYKYNVPKGYVMDNEKKNLNIIPDSISKNNNIINPKTKEKNIDIVNEINSFIFNILNNTIIKFTNEKITHYNFSNILIIQQDYTNGYLWINNELIWKKLEEKYNLSYLETRNFIKSWVDKNMFCKDLIPIKINS